MSAFPTGVAIVTTLEPDGTPRGLTTNAVSSVSAEPPILLVCVDRESRTLPALLHTKRFVVNFMRDDHAGICELFASKADDKFSQVPWTPGLGGVPVLHSGRRRTRAVHDARGARDRGSRGRDRPGRERCPARSRAGADRLVQKDVRERPAAARSGIETRVTEKDAAAAGRSGVHAPSRSHGGGGVRRSASRRSCRRLDRKRCRPPGCVASAGALRRVG